MIVPSVHEEHVGQKTWRSDAVLPLYCEKTPHIFLTALPSYDAVAVYLGSCEKRLRYEKLATSSTAPAESCCPSRTGEAHGRTAHLYSKSRNHPAYGG